MYVFVFVLLFRLVERREKWKEGKSGLVIFLCTREIIFRPLVFVSFLFHPSTFFFFPDERLETFGVVLYCYDYNLSYGDNVTRPELLKTLALFDFSFCPLHDVIFWAYIRRPCLGA